MITCKMPIRQGDTLIFELGKCRALELVHIESGVFRMGSSEDTPRHAYDEPQHSVGLTDSYRIGKYPVTRGQYNCILGLDAVPEAEKDLPVDGISWAAASDFCDVLNRKFEQVLPSGYHFALPTEAQWEFAARGGLLSRHYIYSGSDIAGEVAWYNDNSDFAPHAVGTREPNELGIYDMSGNVREWCSDFYAQYRPVGVLNPQGPVTGISRVRRGGGYDDVTDLCRSVCRDSGDSDDTCHTGFRVALVPIEMRESFEEVSIPPPAPAPEKSAIRRIRQEEIFWNGTDLTLAPDLKLEMRILPSGRIRMERSARHDDTWRLQQIPVDTAFFIARYPVTQELYERVIGENPSAFPGAKRPVESVTWFEAEKFCAKLNELTAGKIPKDFVFALPEQNFWEYAAVGGCYSDRMKHCGWYIANSGGTTHDVGKLSCNTLGLYDMRGNVWEWCRNKAYVNELGDQISDSERGRIPRRAIMGGGWNTAEEVCLFQDIGRKPETRDSEIGFRIILRPKDTMRMQFGYPPLKNLDQMFSQRAIGSWEGGILILPGRLPMPMQMVPKGIFALQSTIHQGNSLRHILESFQISREYWMGRYPVTQKQFEAVMGYNPSIFPGPYRPVESVTLEEALEFCRRLNKLTEGKRPEGYSFALPKYVAWKTAACGGASGSEQNDMAWHLKNANNETHEVGLKQPTLLGFFDCAGNVWEWCSNLCMMLPNGEVPDRPGPDKDKLKPGGVIMGGSWKTPADLCDFSMHGADPESKSAEIGFRVILTATPGEELEQL